jgi:hypothetical protein
MIAEQVIDEREPNIVSKPDEPPSGRMRRLGHRLAQLMRRLARSKSGPERPEQYAAALHRVSAVPLADTSAAAAVARKSSTTTAQRSPARVLSE